MRCDYLVGVTALFVLATAAHADWTARGALLVNSPRDLQIRSADEFSSAVDDGYGIGAAVGYDFPLVRVEGEAVFFRNDLGDAFTDDYSVRGDLDRVLVFGNAFVDLPAAPFLDVYLGVGLGLARASLEVGGEEQGGQDSFAYTDRQTAFGYQLMAGLRVEIVGPLALSAGYRYLVLEDTDFGDGISSISLGGGDHVWEASLGVTF